MNRAAYIITFAGERQECNDGLLSPDTPPQQIYTVSGHESERYKVLETGDAPMQYLMNKAGRESERIFVIAIVSHRVYQKHGDAGSKYDIFRENLQSFAKALGLTDKYGENSLFPVRYDFAEGSGELIASPSVRTSGIINQIYRLIISSCPEAEKSVFIDFTSGLRDISFLMTSVIQFLKACGINLRKIVYSNFYDRKIYSLLHITAVTDLIQAVNAFSLTGNARQLREFFDDSYIIDRIGRENSGELADMKKLLDSLDRFFGCIVINNVNKIDDCKREIEKDMNRIRDSESSPNMYISMFARLFGIIKKQFFLDGSGEISYPNMIRWCLDHDLIIQALTLCVEKMPEEYFRSALIRSIHDPAAAEQETDEPTYGKSPYPAGFYELVFKKALKKVGMKENPILTITQEFSILQDVIITFRNELKDKNKGQPDKKILNGKLIVTDFGTRTSQILKEKYPDLAEHFAKPLNRINKSITENFDSKGILKCDFSCNGDVFTSGMPVFSFLRVVQNSRKVMCWYLGYDMNECREDRKNTYRIKLDNIYDLMTCGKVSDSVMKLANIMKFYLYVKIMRKRINHAQDDAQTSDTDLMAQEKVLSELSKDSCGLISIDTAFDFETIKKMLLKGLELPVPD